MPKSKTQFVCQLCGYRSPKAMGKCPDCGAWNSLVEEISADLETMHAQEKMLKQFREIDSAAVTDLSEPVYLQDIALQVDHRTATGIAELDRVLGGGIVKGSVVLVGGDPGIGKSTLMLQMASAMKDDVLYVSGEESVQQIRSRADRIAPRADRLKVLAETNLGKITQILIRQRPAMVVIDSIQTLFREEIPSAPGSVSQVRECAALLMHIAKSMDITIFLVGHVTKDGTLAGPKVLEHIVDTVLQFEGDAGHLFRILRATKNRYGSTNEIGIFEMTGIGLEEVANPSELFLSERHADQSGSVVMPAVEGSRVLLVEAQALVSPTNYGIPQRTASGFDLRRLQLLIAVLEKRVRLPLGQSDVFMNIVGGLTVDEPAADLAVLCALASSYLDVPVDAQTAVIGEVGLGGEIRAVSNIERRVRESAKLGFGKIILPKSQIKDLGAIKDVQLVGCRRLEEVIQRLKNH